MAEFKEASAGWEKRLLAILAEQKSDISFGQIDLSLQIKNNKVTLVTLTGVTKHFKMDTE